jgi:hypothetical protein
MSHGILTLPRWSHGPMGTFGTLRLGSGSDRRLIGYSLELPWRENQRGISCIPCGAYPLERSRYNKGDYDCWEICDVPGRDEIKIHKGNTIDDVRGCLVLGTRLGWVADKWAVTSSRLAFRRFMAEMQEYETATIIISIAPGTG